MKLGRLPRGLAVAVTAAMVPLLAPPAASAAPAAPTAYTAFASAHPLVWGSSNVPVGELYVPFVWGKTNNFAIARSEAKLVPPDEAPDPMRGEAVAGLTCRGYDEKLCRDPFTAVASAEHRGPDAARGEQAASFVGKNGKFPGGIRALTECPGNCGGQLVRSIGNAAGPAGALTGYVSVGSSSASHELSIDDRGRVISIARSELFNVRIGAQDQVRIGSLVTTAQASGSGTENSKDGKSDLRITDFRILDNQVELTRAGLRTVGGASEQEAYDNGKALLKKLRDEGIVLELPNFDDELQRTPEHVTVNTQGLRVHFKQSVGSVQATALQPIDLGRSAAVVVALDTERQTDVKEDSNGAVVVQTTAPAPAPAGGDSGGPGRVTGGTGVTPPSKGNAGGGRSVPPRSTGGSKVRPGPSSPGTPATPEPSTGGEEIVSPPVDPTAPTEVTDPGLDNPDEVTLPSLRDVTDNLGLRDARSVSRAFGAFLGLGLILPLARFVIRRLG